MKKSFLFKKVYLIGLMSIIISAVMPCSALVNQPYDKSIYSDIVAYFSSTPAAEITERVRIGYDVCQEELDALAQRQIKNKVTLEQITNSSIAVAPTIGMVCSGGGFRASVATLGFLQGLDALGLLDAVTYTSALSGSTWSLASWMFHGYSLPDFESYLRKHLYHAFYPDNIDMQAIARVILSKQTSGRKVTLNDVWGGFQGDVFFSTDSTSGQEAMLSDLAKPVAAGNYPIPLFSSVFANTQPNYRWMEFSPFECGSADYGVWVKPQAFGKKFSNGISTDSYSGENFSYILGICGSAYAASSYDVINALCDALADEFSVGIPSTWFEWIAATWFGSIRISPPKVLNFMRDVKNNPHMDEDTVTLIDAGVSNNLPFIPLFRRNVDMFFVCDASEDCLSPGGHTMKLVEQYAQQNGLQLPAIDYGKIVTQRVSVIVDKNNPAAAIIIYVPNFVGISTLDFDYSDEEFTALSLGIKQALLDNAVQINQAIAYAIDKKQQAAAVQA